MSAIGFRKALITGSGLGCFTLGYSCVLFSWATITISRIGRIEHNWGSSWPSNLSLLVGSVLVSMFAAFMFGTTCSTLGRKPLRLCSFLLGVGSCMVTLLLVSAVNSFELSMVAYFAFPVVSVLLLPKVPGLRVGES